MARTKQATPLRREPSSEYYSKADQNGTPTREPRNLDNEVNGNVVANGFTAAETVIETLAPDAKKEAGALQFLIAVGGIYGSL
jgi:UDP-galactose transporter B1